MDSQHLRPESDGAVFHERLRGTRLIVALLVPLLLIATVAAVRATGLPMRQASPLTAGAERRAPAELQSRAADALEQATGAAGTGYTFQIVQRSTLVPRADGAPLEVPDPADPQKQLSVPSVALGTYLERGFVSPAGFYAEIRRGPDDPLAPLEWDKAPMELAALVRDATTYRNDGAGWYATDRPPGLGLDPATAALLPQMLRDLGDVADVTDATGDAESPQPEDSASPEVPDSPEPGRAGGDPFAALAPTQRLDGATKVADLPGIIAVDLAEATEITGPAEFAFDESGRLVGLRVTARNTYVTDHDLLVDTVITFAYLDAPPELPEPEPTWVPPPTAPDGEE